LLFAHYVRIPVRRSRAAIMIIHSHINLPLRLRVFLQLACSRMKYR
jgi:hypothetical protein